jgi:hypothetical protein
MMGLALGILVADRSMLGRALDLARDVDEAELFLMDEGVHAAGDARLRAAIDDGLDAALCAMDAEARGVAPVAGGPRFGSQFDHAVMVRAARRVVAMTGGRIDDNDVAGAPGPGRRVAVRLTRAAEHPKVAQALRSAVGYAACELEVTVVVEPPARELLAHERHAPSLLRAIGTLQALGHRFVEVASPSTRVSCDVEVSW